MGRLLDWRKALLMHRIQFFVRGEPKPGGSKKAFVNKRTNKAQIVEDCKGNAAWREAVGWAAKAAWKGGPLEGPLRFQAIFFRRRPLAHFRRRSGQLTTELHDWASIAVPQTKPDATKLLRSTEDALTGILWIDDAQVVSQAAGKLYGDQPGAIIIVETIEAESWIKSMANWLPKAKS